MDMVRLRFAPSPTGALHIGGARTALFNWLLVQRLGGSFILRIEDTDAERSTEDSAAGILDDLLWLGLNWDEGPMRGGDLGPYYQSQRLDIYRRYADRLLAEDKAYPCFCTPEELQRARQRAAEAKQNYRYDRRCAQLHTDEITLKKAQNEPFVIRLRCPATGTTTVQDLVRGEVEFQNELAEDIIIMKSDGHPTYNFAVVVDDHLMNISHVLRAEEHLPNTPKQLMIYRALEWEPPKFAHVSMILAPDRSKLSKRHGATSVKEFREAGYMPESLLNYLALLGWSPGDDREIMSLDEIIAAFNFNQLNKAPAIYDIEKIAWMNAHYIANATLDKLCCALETRAQELGYLHKDNYQYYMQVVDLIKSRLKNLNDFVYDAAYFFNEVDVYDDKAVNRYFSPPPVAMHYLRIVYDDIASMSTTLDAQLLEQSIRALAERHQFKLADIVHPLRLALTGRRVSPGIFEVMALLGLECCLHRIENALTYIESLDH